MLLFTPQPHYHPRDQYLRSLAANARERYLTELADGYSYRRPSCNPYNNVQEALAREYYRQQEAAVQEEFARRAALEHRRQQQLERQRLQHQGYLAELERRRYLDAIHRAQQGYGWSFEPSDSEDDFEEPHRYREDKNISPPSSSSSNPISTESNRSSTSKISLELEIKAATIIQSAYRAHISRRHALSSLLSIRESLDALSSSFVFPAKPSFDSTPDCLTHKLSYNSINAPIHAYEDGLMSHLSKLDSVESNGDAVVRKERKRLARDIEAELARLDQRKEDAWETQRVEMELRVRPNSDSEVEEEDKQLPVLRDAEMEDNLASANPEVTMNLPSSEDNDEQTFEEPEAVLESSMEGAIDHQPLQATPDVLPEATSPLVLDTTTDSDSDSEMALASLFPQHDSDILQQQPQPTSEARTEEEFILVDSEAPQSLPVEAPEEDRFVML